MKKVNFFMPLLFFATEGKAQFNTASFEDKVATIQVSKFDENHFEGTFLNYQFEGLSNKKRRKAETKKEQEQEKQAKEKKDIPDQQQTLILDDVAGPATAEKKVFYKKLNPINEKDLDYIETQAV
ncbi:MAG: hypothetical protein EOP33_08140, partial [Rickettsiaceae bacterium]